jgi:vitamin B12 transporter
MRIPLAAAGTALLATSALPQIALAQAPLVLEEIVVSADRVPADPARTGSSVSVVTAEDIADQRLPFALDYLTQVPGFTVNQNGPAGTVSGFALRGLPQQYVRVLVDGIEISDPTAPQVTPSLSNLLVGDIGRIEVLKGSQSALYGGQAVGGVIDIRTVAPEREGVEHRLYFEGGSFDTYRGAYTLTARTDRAEFAATVQGLRTDGFSAAEELDGNDEEDGYETGRASFAGTFHLTDTTALTASGFVQREDGDFDAGPGAGDGEFDPDFGAAAGDADNTFDADSYGASLGLEFEALGAENRVAVQRFQIDRTQDEASAASISKTEGTRDRIEYLGRRSFGDGLTMQLGADYTREETDSSRTGPGFASAGTFDSWIAGGFGQAIWVPVDPLTVSAALRYDHHSEFEGHVTGRLTAAYQLGALTLLRGSLGTGFRPPSHFELFDGSFGNPELDPEESVSADLGLERSFLDGRARASATLFWIEVSDLIEFDLATSRYVQSDGTSENRGLELAAEWDPVERLTLGLAYTYTDAEDPAGDQRDRVPRHDLVLGAEWSATDRLTLAGTLQHVADVEGDTAVPDGTRDIFGDYTLVNARAGFALTETAELYVRAANLFDEEYQTARGFGTADRAFYAGLAARF